MLLAAGEIVQWLGLIIAGLALITSAAGVAIVWIVLPTKATITALKKELSERIEFQFDQKLALHAAKHEGRIEAITTQCAEFQGRFAAGHAHMGKLDDAIVAASHRDQELRIELLRSISELKDGMVTKDYLREMLDERT